MQYLDTVEDSQMVWWSKDSKQKIKKQSKNWKVRFQGDRDQDDFNICNEREQLTPV